MNIINQKVLFAEENSLWFRGYVVGKQFPGRKGPNFAYTYSLFPFSYYKKKKKKKKEIYIYNQLI